jgi:hypothetical protein
LAALAKSWTIQYPFVTSAGPVYEYAGHDGNSAMTDILRVARQSEAEAEAEKKK